MANPFSHPSYLLPPLTILVITLVLTAFVWREARRSLSSQIFCGLLISVGLWCFLIFGMRSSPDVHRALLWDRTLPLTTCITFVLYYHFTLIYTKTSGQRGFLLASYLLLGLVVVLTPTDLIIERMRLAPYGYTPVVGPVTFPLIVFYPLLMAGGAYNLLKRYRLSFSYEEKNRLLYLTMAVPFPLAGMFLDAFSNLPPASIWGNLIFCIICSIAILRYHLLDIRVVVQKSLVYLLVSALIAIPYVGALFFLNLILKTRGEPWWTHAFIILCLAIILRPLYSRVQQLVDRLFYRDRYDYLIALERFSRQAQSVTKFEELSSTMVQLVSGALRVSSTCLLLPSEGKHGLVTVSCTGLKSPPSGVVLRNSSPLIKWLELHGDILSSEQLDIVPQLQSLSLTEKDNLERIAAKVLVPIRSHENKLLGILVLGKKLSEQTYSNEDKHLLVTLSNQMVMALENARLYNDAVQARVNLEAWLNSMTDCVMILNTDYVIEFMNRAAIEKFGNRLGEKCYHSRGKDTVCTSCPIQHCLRGDDRNGQNFSKSIGGRDYDIAAAPLSNIDGTLSIVMVLRDITERKQAEERQHQLQEELQRASRLAAIGELAAGVAHELNNPLTGITGYSQLLLKEYVDEKVRKGLEKINSEAWRAAKVVENLRTFARRRDPKKEYSNINEILQKALELRIYELKANNVHVVTELDSTLPEVMVDFHQIQEVFLNIIINAEQAMTEANRGGQITIKTQKQRGYIRIIFMDNGPGIPAEHINKVFDPFFTTRGERDGTGLGLSICHSIVTEHGGKISVKSKPGEGATFFVELPVQIEKGD